MSISRSAHHQTVHSLCLRRISCVSSPIPISLTHLTSADYSTGASYHYTYDAAGNRTTLSDATGTHTYTYDAANCLTSVDGVTYTYDQRGNLTGDGTNTYGYDGAGRMVQAITPVATLVYTGVADNACNADGLRVAQEQGGVATTFVWDWATGVPELLSDGDHVYLVGHDTLGWTTDGEWTFILPDALGSARQTTDATGAVTGSREWSPFGVESGEAQGGWGYAGEVTV
ncbi:MAG: hypothetical protein JXA33_07950 [Anaerolineae bacterium]|nr:hypothetical protein [Anaerolineae bacterium]